MITWLKQSKVIYVLSNILVLPATIIPRFDFLANLSFIVSFILFDKKEIFILLAICLVFIMKNNANYRFKLLLKLKGEELSKSDYDCVYLYAWCTILRYLLIGITSNEILISLNK